MLFHIEHITEYRYSETVTESFSEIRLRPRDSLRQRVSRHYSRVEPAAVVESYTDYFGNFVETVSIPFRHQSLAVTSVCDVETKPKLVDFPLSDLTVADAQQLYSSQRRELHDFLRPSHFVQFAPGVSELAAEFFPPSAPVTEALSSLNEYLFQQLRYRPGVTDCATTVTEFLSTREGVCQDFAHLMISICRAAGLPARYVSGYIETDPVIAKDDERDAPELIGATASHAWVEVYSPAGVWIGYDPTNNILEGERHVQIGIGRDYEDVPPLKGVYKGNHSQALNVQVRVTRGESPAPRS